MIKHITAGIVLMLILSEAAQAQKNKTTQADVYYLGGISQLENNFHRQMNFDINKGKYREYYLLFRIEVNKGGVIRT